MNYTEGRNRIVEWLRKQLIGPASGHETLRGISPLERYPTGVLFPIIRGEEGIDPASDSDEEDDDYANKNNSWSKATYLLNIFSAIVFLVAIISTISYVWCNT